jgi:hypothetical protein
MVQYHLNENRRINALAGAVLALGLTAVLCSMTGVDILSVLEQNSLAKIDCLYGPLLDNKQISGVGDGILHNVAIVFPGGDNGHLRYKNEFALGFAERNGKTGFIWDSQGALTEDVKGFLLEKDGVKQFVIQGNNFGITSTLVGTGSQTSFNVEGRIVSCAK